MLVYNMGNSGSNNVVFIAKNYAYNKLTVVIAQEG